MSMYHASRLTLHAPLLLILLIYLALAIIHSQIVPLTTGNDEWAHFQYARFISEHSRLPATNSQRDQAGYKSDAPPLYHLLVAGVTAGIEPTRLLRPLDMPRRYLADNIIDSYALVHTAVEQMPYRGEVLMWHLGRVVSILFGMALISLTYVTGLVVFSAQHHPALLAAALVAFIPSVLFHSSVLSYESLSAFFSALFLLVALALSKQPWQWRRWLALGVVAGLSITTKYSAVLLPLEMVFVAGLVWFQVFPRQGQALPFKQLFLRLIIAGLAMLLASSWWFGFVIWHFNAVDTQGPVAGILQPLLVGDASDTTSVQVAGFLFGQETIETRSRPLLERNFAQLGLNLIHSFWAAPVNGRFGPVVLPALATLAALSGLIGLGRVWRRADLSTRAILILLLFHAGLILPLVAMRIFLSFDPREAAQGRHILLPGVSAIVILLVWGWKQWSAKIGPVVAGGLLLWSGLGQIAWAAIVYPSPIPVWPQTASAPAVQESALLPQNVLLLENAVQLTGASWQLNATTLEVTLWWKALATLKEDYLIELSLLNKSNQIVSYTVGHPAQGRYPFRAWEPGDVVQDIHQLPISQPLAGNYRLQLQLLTHSAQPLLPAQMAQLEQINLQAQPARTDSCRIWPQPSGLLVKGQLRPRATLNVVSSTPPVLKPIAATGAATEQTPIRSIGENHIFVVGYNWPAAARLMAGTTNCGQIRFDIPPRNFNMPPIPQPLEANFNNEIKLLGYELPTRRIQPGHRLPLTLYWQALNYMGEDYRLFVSPLNAGQQRWGGYDRRPRDGYSTLRWVPDEIIIDSFGVPVEPDAPPGIYTLDIGFYRQTEAGAESLPLMQNGQPLEARSLRLGPIKIGGPPPAVVTVNPNPQIRLNQSLGPSGEITLLGYDLYRSKLNAQNLTLTLYWRVEMSLAADYTTFLHLRDASNQTVTQKDAPPANGRYPTSLWDSGEVIIDKIELSLVDIPPGQYKPVTGLYNFATGERLLVTGIAANEITLEPVTIQ